jgi:hypothetical protein
MHGGKIINKINKNPSTFPVRKGEHGRQFNINSSNTHNSARNIIGLRSDFIYREFEFKWEIEENLLSYMQMKVWGGWAVHIHPY